MIGTGFSFLSRWAGFSRCTVTRSMFKRNVLFFGSIALALPSGHVVHLVCVRSLRGHGDQWELGVARAAGRFIVPDDDRTGATPVAVISYGLLKPISVNLQMQWASRFL